MCDFRDIIKICEGDLYYMYCDNEYYFQDDLFISFLVAINFVQENINIQWVKYLNIKVDHLTFDLLGNIYHPHLKIRHGLLFLLCGMFLRRCGICEIVMSKEFRCVF